MKSIPILPLALALFFLTTGIQPVSAITITAYEQIADTRSGGGPRRVDLRRSRSDGINSPVIIRSDDTIRGQNSVSASFGDFDPRNVRFTHRVDWLGVPVFTGAVLTIVASSVSNGFGTGDDDTVRVDGMVVGALQSGSTSFLFSGAEITALLADDRFRVSVNKSPGDSIEISRSRLTLFYEIPDAVSVPDGGSNFALLGLALVGIAGLRRPLRAIALRA
jgi:hypothetical protein